MKRLLLIALLCFSGLACAAPPEPLPPEQAYRLAASLLAAYLLQVLILLAVVSLHAGPGTLAPSSTAILIVTRGLLATLRLCVYLFIGLLIVQAVVSWFSPHSPLYRPIYQMTYPVLQPLRKIIPPVSGIDLTPLIAILLAQIALLLL